VRGTILRAEVGLDLDDPTDDPSEFGVVTDQARPQQIARGLEGRAGEAGPLEDRPADQARG